MSVQLSRPDEEPQPRGRENMQRMTDYTSAEGRQQFIRERRRDLTRQQLETLLRRHLARPRRLGL